VKFSSKSTLSMHLEQALSAVAVILGLSLLWRLYKELKSPLRDVPGPLLARWTRWWYFNRVRHGKFELDNIHLHRRYGKIVRLAPGHYSIDDPTAVKTIYGIGTQFTKSSWYGAFQPPNPNLWSLFPDRNIKRHAETRKKFAPMYSMTSLVNYEPFVDTCADLFVEKLQGFANSSQEVNMGHWFQCYAFDLIGDITFSKRFGFLDNGEDIDGAMAAIDRSMAYSTLIGIFSEWHAFLFNPMQKFKSSGAAGRAYIIKFSQNLVQKRLQSPKTPSSNANVPIDLLDRIVEAHNSNPEKVTKYDISMMPLFNIFAGSDTTASSLSAILFYLLKTPRCLQKLQEEIDSFASRGLLSEMPTFKESLDMPYLQAVMREALRLHGATGLPMWRDVPAGGAVISGKFFPEGSVVGINTWVAHYNPDVFEDAEEFKPERWLGDSVEVKVMDTYYMPVSIFVLCTSL
jgi:cytochrome P450